jgi:hypothetical protein
MADADRMDELVDLWPGDEENSEEEHLQPDFVRETVVFATDWTVETILNQIEKANITLNPSFQRRDAWTNGRKSKFIESLFLGLPVPQIVLAEQLGQKGKYLVLDGKQRLLAMARFRGFPAYGEALELSGLEVLSDLNTKGYPQIKDDPGFIELLDGFENQTVRTVVVRNWRKIELLHAIFIRLNTGSVQLSPQELRQALIPGAFTTWIDKRSGESAEIQALLGINEPDFRMRDIELLLRLVGFGVALTRYKGNLRDFLDKTSLMYNQNWAQMEAHAEVEVQNIESALRLASEVFPDGPGRKWKDARYEGRLNRAALDCQVFYFRDAAVRTAVAGKEAEVKAAWETLCEADVDFMGAIETTTKSIAAVKKRLGAWGAALSNVVGIAMPALIVGTAE